MRVRTVAITAAIATLLVGLVAVPAQAASRPGKPVSVTATAGVGKYTVKWKAAAANGAKVTRYQVSDRRYGRSWSSWTTYKVGASVRSKAISGTAGSLHQVRVRAKNGKGWGSWSSPKSVRIINVPSPPTSVRAVAGDGRVTVSWAAPATNGSALTGFRVYSRSYQGVWTAWVPRAVIASARTTLFTGLVNARAYQFYVVATSAAGTSKASATAGATPGAPDTTAPGPVTALAVETRTTSSITLSWSNPSSSDFAQVIVRRAAGAQPPVSAGAGSGMTLTSPKATSVTDAGLTPGSTYSYAVFTRDTTGNTSTPASTISAATLPLTIWDQPNPRSVNVSLDANESRGDLVDPTGATVRGQSTILTVPADAPIDTMVVRLTPTTALTGVPDLTGTTTVGTRVDLSDQVVKPLTLAFTAPWADEPGVVVFGAGLDGSDLHEIPLLAGDGLSIEIDRSGVYFAVRSFAASPIVTESFTSHLPLHPDAQLEHALADATRSSVTAVRTSAALTAADEEVPQSSEAEVANNLWSWGQRYLQPTVGQWSTDCELFTETGTSALRWYRQAVLAGLTTNNADHAWGSFTDAVAAGITAGPINCFEKLVKPCLHADNIALALQYAQLARVISLVELLPAGTALEDLLCGMAYGKVIHTQKVVWGESGFDKTDLTVYVSWDYDGVFWDRLTEQPSSFLGLRNVGNRYVYSSRYHENPTENGPCVYDPDGELISGGSFHHDAFGAGKGPVPDQNGVPALGIDFLTNQFFGNGAAPTIHTQIWGLECPPTGGGPFSEVSVDDTGSWSIQAPGALAFDGSKFAIYKDEVAPEDAALGAVDTTLGYVYFKTPLTPPPAECVPGVDVETEETLGCKGSYWTS